jgi:dTDP-4-dehydrorhamnose reductase
MHTPRATVQFLPMRIVITGAAGQLGRELQLALAGHELVAYDRADLDVTDEREVRRTVLPPQADAVIHCAALTDTARCEREPEIADAVNGLGTEHVARACLETGARLVAVSTNEVFDGEAASPYREDAEPHPVNAYGRSKLLGERLARDAHAETLIVRTSWVYARGGANFPEKVLAAAARGGPLRFVTDEVASPTAASDLASAIRRLLEARAPAGIYHLAGGGAASRYEWAREVVRLASIDVPVEAITTAELRAAGYEGPKKPPYSVLANTRAAALGIGLREWREALAEYFASARVARDG